MHGSQRLRRFLATPSRAATQLEVPTMVLASARGLINVPLGHASPAPCRLCVHPLRPCARHSIGPLSAIGKRGRTCRRCSPRPAQRALPKLMPRRWPSQSSASLVPLSPFGASVRIPASALTPCSSQPNLHSVWKHTSRTRRHARRSRMHNAFMRTGAPRGVRRAQAPTMKFTDTV